MSKLECPHCDHKNDIEDTDLDWEVDAENQIHCEECERDFIARAEHQVVFSCETLTPPKTAKD